MTIKISRKAARTQRKGIFTFGEYAHRTPHHPSPITHHPHRVGSAGRGMNGERAPGPALSYVEGVNRQTAGNLARQRRPQSGGVCKVQCGSNPTRRMMLCHTQPKQAGKALCFTGPCIDFRCLTRAGRFPFSSLDLWYFLSRESTEIGRN